jgi:hypothetical protein
VGDLALAIALVSRWVSFDKLRTSVRLWHVPNVRGNSEHNLLKNAKGRLSHVLIFSKSELSAKPFTYPRGKTLLENCRPFFETQICPGPIATNIHIYLLYIFNIYNKLEDRTFSLIFPFTGYFLYTTITEYTAATP